MKAILSNLKTALDIKNDPRKKAKALIQKKDWKKAALVYGSIIKQELTKQDYYEYAKCCRFTKDLKTGFRIINEGLELFEVDKDLLVELSLLHMVNCDWENAKKSWQKLNSLYDLSEINYLRYLRVLEELKSWKEYNRLLGKAVELFPDSQCVSARVALSLAVSELSNANFIAAEKHINTLEKSVIKVWPINKSTVKELKDALDFEKPLKTFDDNSSFCIVANRKDGLGERLNALVAGIYLSKRFDCPFLFEWDDNLHNEAVSLGLNVVDDKGHAITSKSQMFTREFIEKYSVVPEEHKGKFKNLDVKNFDKNKLDFYAKNNGITFINAPRVDVDPLVVDTLKTSSKYSLKDAFNEIGFSDNVNSLLNLAKQSINKDTVAIHLRTGDVLYGQYRKFVNYTYKGLCLPLVEKIIKDEILLGNNIVLFGQESGVLNHLKEKYNVTISDDLVPNHISDSTELAIFEMALMSNCKSIIAGSSGFAKISSRIGNIKLEPGFRRYRAAEQTEFILQHLSNCDSHYNDNHSAFSYWYAYFYGRQNKSNRESIDILKKASHFDPNNEVYKLIMFFLANESENKKETNYLAKEIIDAGFTKLSIEGSSYKSILTSRTTGKLNLNEYISKFRYDKANETYDQFGHELCSMIDETLKELN